MKYYWIVLTILATVSQIFHTWWAIDKFSTLSGKAKTVQNIMFCTIIEMAIIGFVLDGKHLYALAGAIVAITVNWYYYQHNFTKNHTLKKTWLAYFFAVLIPICIFVFSLQI